MNINIIYPQYEIKIIVLTIIMKMGKGYLEMEEGGGWGWEGE